MYQYGPLRGSVLSSREEEGRERLFCPACQWIHYENPLPKIAFSSHREIIRDGLNKDKE